MKKNWEDLSDIVLFVEVARTGSFKQASANLDVPGATLSRRIARLEKHVGVCLFNRSTRRVILTDEARSYYERCAQLVDEMQHAHDALRERVDRAAGYFRISMAVDIAIHFIGPLLRGFSEIYPAISIGIDASPRRADLMGEHINVAFRVGNIASESLIARKLGDVRMGLYASPRYLERHPYPGDPSALIDLQHICLRNDEKPKVWRFERASDHAAYEIPVSGRFALNSVGLAQLLVEQQLGIAVLPCKVAKKAVADGRLVHLLADYGLPAMPLNAIMSTNVQPANVRAFIDYVSMNISME